MHMQVLRLFPSVLEENWIWDWLPLLFLEAVCFYSLRSVDSAMVSLVLVPNNLYGASGSRERMLRQLQAKTISSKRVLHAAKTSCNNCSSGGKGQEAGQV